MVEISISNRCLLLLIIILDQVGGDLLHDIQEAMYYCGAWVVKRSSLCYEEFALSAWTRTAYN